MILTIVSAVFITAFLSSGNALNRQDSYWGSSSAENNVSPRPSYGPSKRPVNWREEFLICELKYEREKASCESSKYPADWEDSYNNYPNGGRPQETSLRPFDRPSHHENDYHRPTLEGKPGYHPGGNRPRPRPRPVTERPSHMDHDGYPNDPLLKPPRPSITTDYGTRPSKPRPVSVSNTDDHNHRPSNGDRPRPSNPYG